MSKTNPPYPAAFRAGAVALVRTSGKSIPAVARDLGVSEQGLRDWVKRAAIEAGAGPPGALTSSEREALVRLRRENRVLQHEREILKKPRPSSPGRQREPVSVRRGGEGQLSDRAALPGVDR